MEKPSDPAAAGITPRPPQYSGQLPGWVRVALAPVGFRIAVVGVLTAGYLLTYHLVEHHTDRLALRPINLLILVLAGGLFGVRGGVGIGAGLALLNILLYARDGIFDDSLGRAIGNLLSVAAGVFAGAVIGKARDLSITLRAEVHRREELERQKDEFTELLVHDFKNPLAAILGHSALLLQEGMAPEDIRDSAESILSSAERLKRMVLNLLDIGRAEDGQLRPNLAEVDLNQLALEVEQSVQRQIRDRRQRLELLHATNSTVVADIELVRRILVNLVDNASKYTPPDRTIRMGIEPHLDAVVVAIADEGPGIPSGQEERIFEKYVRLDRVSNDGAQGSRGLGLTFCRLAAEVHGGHIWVERSQPSGSVFRLKLPRGGPRLPSASAQR